MYNVCTYILWRHSSWFAIDLVYVEVGLRLRFCFPRFHWRFRGNSCGNPFCHTFCHKTSSSENRRNFVPGFVASSQVWRNFNEILDEISTFFFVAKCCGKMFFHKENVRQNARGDEILPCGKTCWQEHFSTQTIHWNFVKDFVASTEVPVKFERIPHENLTKEFVAKSYGKMFCRKAPDEKSNEIPMQGKSMNKRQKSLYQNILQVVAFHGGVPLQHIFECAIYYKVNCVILKWCCILPNGHCAF